MVNYYILQGEKGTGKTTALLNLINDSKLHIAGVLTLAVDMERYLFNIETQEEYKLTVDCDNDDGVYKIGHYCFSKRIFEKGNRFILLGNRKDVDLLIVDEAGFLELENKGFHSALSVLAVEKNVKVQNILIVVRSFLVNEIVAKYFNKNNVTILTIDILDTAIS